MQAPSLDNNAALKLNQKEIEQLKKELLRKEKALAAAIQTL
ncbi:hypothetical protein [Pragia fontium]|nr:hypothetical protein [Pragia fontium]